MVPRGNDDSRRGGGSVAGGDQKSLAMPLISQSP
jgi:hypothetical protein